jgi:hypothetical protein
VIEHAIDRGEADASRFRNVDQSCAPMTIGHELHSAFEV